MPLIACLFLAIPPAVATCPLESLTVADGTVAWGGLRVDAPLVDIQKELGCSVDLRADPEWPGGHASVLVGGRPVWLTFHEVGDVPKLSSMSIRRINGDGPRCWARESLVAEVNRTAPRARYLPSRHQPDESEASNRYPMYALDDRGDLVVLLKPSEGTIYVGHLSDLD